MGREQFAKFYRWAIHLERAGVNNRKKGYSIALLEFHFLGSPSTTLWPFGATLQGSR